MSRMMPKTRLQLRFFVVLAALTVGYSAVAYLDIARVAGIGYYDLHVELPDGGGLYPGSIVTLSGVEVGQVTQMQTGPNRVRAKVRIENGTEIPTSVRAEVRSISAAGEQYLDLANEAGSGRRAAAARPGKSRYGEGDTIPVTAATVPIQTADLLHQVDGLVESIPVKDLDTTIDELGVGLSEGAEDLTRFLDAILPLQRRFTNSLNPTKRLIVNGQPVLETQAAARSQIATATRGLAEFTTRLQRHDEALRESLKTAPAMANQVTGLVRDLGPTLPAFLDSLTQVGEVTSIYDPGIRHILTMVPAVVNGFQTALNVSPVRGAVSLFARANVNHPPACTQGFIQERRSARDTTPLTPPTHVFCDVPQDSKLAVRGARNYPCPNGVGRGPSAASCGLHFQTRNEVDHLQAAALATQVAVAKGFRSGAEEGTVPYDPTSGLAMSSDGPLFVLGSARTSKGTDDSWESLLLGPLGLS